MKKMILVIDEVYSCMDCPVTLVNNICEGCYLTISEVLNGTSDFIEGTRRHISCPLRPMPERKEVHYTDPLFGEVENLTNIGYNKCLDDLGETE